ncbi:major facilitator superfamily domain-containing protein [Venturia nashicola]|uniref:Major facilitator superfamily domain-containing protein n=1 Tax=Venturia nashicola TaxID=86259 RepID=A0A4Z1NSR2_9PEZI|nr:major facilitator superfamily domain-containing protein [Venturia nashicola]
MNDQTSPSPTEIGSTHLEKDIEKEGVSRGVSIRTTPIPSLHGDSKLEIESEEQDDPNIVGWDGVDDPENPLNWPSKRKWAAVGMISVVTFLTPLGSSIFAPGVPLVMDEFHSESQILEGFVVSVYVLGFAFGPLIIAPLSEMFGRLPLYHASAFFFVIFNIACAVSSSLNQLIIFRFFAGSFGAAPLALGGGTIADVASKEQRATAMAIWVLGPTVGPVIGPIVGGFISHYLGWRWNFYILGIAAGCALVGGLFLMKETYAPTILKQKTARLQKETGNMALRSKLDMGLTPGQLFRYSIVRPTKMLAFSPIVLSLSLYVAIVYSYLYLMFTTVTVIFETQYGFASDLVGLAFLGIGIGSFGGQFIYTYLANRSYAAHMAKGDFKPEHRLETMIPGAFMVPISLFWYGWSVQANVQWMCPIIGMSFFGFGLLLIFMPANTYLIDVFTNYAASAMAANTVLRSVVAAILPMAGPKLYKALGYGWGNSLLGFIAAAMIPIPFVFLRYGERIRTNKRFRITF